MNNYLFFRTDRIGDFLLSAVLLKSIKRNDIKSFITIVASEKNYEYIQTLKFVDKVILYPNNLFKKIQFFLQILKTNYFSCGVLDGKKRSIYACILVKAQNKFIITTKKLFKKLISPFINNTFYTDDFDNKIDETKNILKIFNFSFDIKDLDLFESENINEIRFSFGNDIFKLKNFLLLHFDEKWIFDTYIKKFTRIEPNYNELNKFLYEIIKKTKNDLVITSGNLDLQLIHNLKNNFTKKTDQIYFKKIENNIIYLLIKTNFFDLKKIIFNSKLIISCHGAPTHVAAGMNKRIIDIFNSDDEKWYKKWNSHFRNYEFIHRSQFKILSLKILSKL